MRIGSERSSSVVGFVVAVGFAVVLGSAVVMAEEEERATRADVGERAVLLQEIVVTGSRVERPIAQEPVSVYVITREDLQQSGVRTVGDALRWVPGIDISGGATFGASVRTTAIVQGMPAQYSLILVDGFRTKSDHIHTGVNLELIPVSMIERIEVVQGPGSAVHGSDALGGIVNIITKPVPEERTLSVSGAMGTDDTIDFSVLQGDRRGKFGYLVNTCVSSSDGIGGEGNEYSRVNGRVKFLYEPSPALSTNVAVAYYEGKYPTSEDSMYEYKLEIKAKPPVGRLRGMVGHTDYDRTFKSGAAETENDVSSVVLQYDRTFWDRNHVIFGVDWRRERFVRIATPEKDTDITSVYLQNEYAFNKETTLLVGARLDTEEEMGTEFSPRTALHWRRNPLNVRLSIAKGFRIPSLQDRYEVHFDHGTFYRDGNPDLEPETSIHYSLGVEYEMSSYPVVVAGTVFRNDLEDLIVLVDTGVVEDGRPVFRRENLQEAHTQGLEVGIRRLPLREGLNWRVVYTFLEGKDETNDEELAYAPTHTVKGGLFYTVKQGLTLSTTFEMAADRKYRDKSGKSQELDDYFLVDCHLIVKVSENLDLSFSVKNVFDTEFETYEEGKAESSYGRFVTMGLKATF